MHNLKRFLLLALSIFIINNSSFELFAGNDITQENKDLIESIIELVKEEYIDETDENEIVESAINGMLQSLDPHSIYLNPKNFEELKNDTKGEFAGLGIEVTMERGLVKVISPIDGTPAYKAGISEGDYITHINKEAVLGKSLSEAVDLMRGKENTSIEITIAREGIEDGFDLTIIREIIKIPGILAKIEGKDKNIGYLRVSAFNEKTAEKLYNEIIKLEHNPLKKIESYILDLRRNPGGLLSQAIEVSNMFINNGLIVSTKRPRFEKTISEYAARRGDLISDKPVVVLVNGGSASASEIVAGALQDNNRAIILGTRTFGKGSVQTLFPLTKNKLFFTQKEKYGAVKLTTAEYYTPSGKSIQAKGITPDFIIDQNKEDDQNSDLFQVGETQLNQHIKNKGEGEESGSSAYIPKDENKDTQLVEAIEILSNLNKRIINTKRIN